LMPLVFVQFQIAKIFFLQKPLCLGRQLSSDAERHKFCAHSQVFFLFTHSLHTLATKAKATVTNYFTKVLALSLQRSKVLHTLFYYFLTRTCDDGRRKKRRRQANL
jgi:hypothetical protein